jgi:hypothetical protein
MNEEVNIRVVGFQGRECIASANHHPCPSGFASATLLNDMGWCGIGSEVKSGTTPPPNVAPSPRRAKEKLRTMQRRHH